MSTVTVVPAAGSGTRLGAGLPKAFVPLAGESLVQRTLGGLRLSRVVDAVIVVVPDGRLAHATAELGGTGVGIDVVVVAGGADRTASVRAGLAAAGGADRILVHDAARALTPPELIARVVSALGEGHRAVVPAIALTDTVKAVDRNGAVLGTPARAGLRAVQTPQGFDAAVLRRAYDRLTPEAFTDDASMVEALGVPVQTVPGDPLAFKITTPMDLRLAQTLLAEAPA